VTPVMSAVFDMGVDGQGTKTLHDSIDPCRAGSARSAASALRACQGDGA
jgi:hypothetical protein